MYDGGGGRDPRIAALAGEARPPGASERRLPASHADSLGRRRSWHVILAVTACAVLFGCTGSVTPARPGVASSLPDLPPPDARAAWRPIDLRDEGRIGAAYAASLQVRGQAGARYAWIAINLGNPIRLPEVEQEARSVMFLGEYQCGRRAWRAIEALWYRDPDGRMLLLREAPRGAGDLQPVAEHTLTDTFLDAICRG